jgi:hypothetical protein
MKKSLIWTAVGVAVIGIGVPAYAAVQTTKPLPSITTVKTTVEDVKGNCDEAEHANDPRCAAVAAPATPVTQPTRPNVSVEDSTHDSMDDNGVDNSTHDSLDDNGIDATTNSIDDDDAATHDADDDNGDDNGIDATSNSIDDSTSNSVEDISGPCDEAEHANDPSCAGGAAAPVTSVDDNPAPVGGVDDSGHHNGGDDSGHGGSDG